VDLIETVVLAIACPTLASLASSSRLIEVEALTYNYDKQCLAVINVR